MVYAVLNGLLFLILLWFSSFADIQSDSFQVKRVITPIIFLALVAIFNAACIMLSTYGNERIASMIGKFYMILMAYFYVLVTTYVCQFPNSKSTVLSKILNFLLIILSVYIVFFKIESVSADLRFGLVVKSDTMELLGLSWKKIYEIIYFAILPAYSVLSILLRLEVTKNKLSRQQMFLLALSVVSSFATMALFGFMGDNLLPAFYLLMPFVGAFEIFLFYRIVRIQVLFDAKTGLIVLVDFIVNYLFLGVIAGVSFALLEPLRISNFFWFLIVYALIICVILFIRYHLTKLLGKLKVSRTSNYLQEFERDLVSLDYTENPELLFETFVGYFKKNVNTDKLDFLIKSGEDDMTTLYSSRNKTITIPANSPILDVVLNSNHTIIFKSHLETKRYYDSVKKELTELFEKTESEVLILLTEGRHVFSAMFLGSKYLGNDYTDYDYAVFSRFYSYFFVFGYYLKNIANESVVGTVTREIQMSGQIIQSIQENMDFIRNPKVDVGYLSVAAHDLGGEYIDFIKLNEDKHIFILGDISGKGINASMSAVIMKSIVRTFLAETKDFKQLVQKVNVFIRNHLPKETFFAGVFGLIDFAENTIYYLNCGVPALLMYNQSYNNVIEIQGEGRVLGFVKNIEKLIKVKKIKLNPGDIIFACTAGLLNSKNIRGERFGKDRVQQSIIENLGFPAEKMSQFAYNQLLEFTSKELEDDISVLTIKFISK